MLLNGPKEEENGSESDHCDLTGLELESRTTSAKTLRNVIIEFLQKNEIKKQNFDHCETAEIVNEAIKEVNVKTSSRKRDKPKAVENKIQRGLRSIECEEDVLIDDCNKKPKSYFSLFQQLKRFLRVSSRKKVYLDLGMSKVSKYLSSKCKDWSEINEYLKREYEKLIEESFREVKKVSDTLAVHVELESHLRKRLQYFKKCSAARSILLQKVEEGISSTESNLLLIGKEHEGKIESIEDEYRNQSDFLERKILSGKNSASNEVEMAITDGSQWREYAMKLLQCLSKESSMKFWKIAQNVDQSFRELLTIYCEAFNEDLSQFVAFKANFATICQDLCDTSLDILKNLKTLVEDSEDQKLNADTIPITQTCISEIDSKIKKVMNGIDFVANTFTPTIENKWIQGKTEISIQIALSNVKNSRTNLKTFYDRFEHLKNVPCIDMTLVNLTIETSEELISQLGELEKSIDFGEKWIEELIQSLKIQFRENEQIILKTYVEVELAKQSSQFKENDGLNQLIKSSIQYAEDFIQKIERINLVMSPKITINSRVGADTCIKIDSLITKIRSINLDWAHKIDFSNANGGAGMSDHSIAWSDFIKLAPEMTPEPDESAQMALRKLEKCLNHSASIIDSSEANNSLLTNLLGPNKVSGGANLDSKESYQGDRPGAEKKGRRKVKRIKRDDQPEAAAKPYTSESSKSKDNFNLLSSPTAEIRTKRLPRSAP